jgi:hypothetical protein
MPRDPITPLEWQDAVDGAQFYLHLDACRQYGLLTGGPEVNIERCEEILRRGDKLGYRPADAVELVKKFIRSSR